MIVDHLPLFYSVMVVTASILAGITLWARVRRWMKVLCLGLTAIWFVTAYGALADLLSRPKPVDLEFANSKVAEAEVIAGRIIENEAIFVWLGLENEVQPRAYQLPWDLQLAEELRKALEEGKANGTQAFMRLPFEPTLDHEEPRFYALPQPRLPLKPLPDPETERFRGPESAA